MLSSSTWFTESARAGLRDEDVEERTEAARSTGLEGAVVYVEAGGEGGRLLPMLSRDESTTGTIVTTVVDWRRKNENRFFFSDVGVGTTAMECRRAADMAKECARERRHSSGHDWVLKPSSWELRDGETRTVKRAVDGRCLLVTAVDPRVRTGRGQRHRPPRA